MARPVEVRIAPDQPLSDIESSSANAEEETIKLSKHCSFESLAHLNIDSMPSVMNGGVERRRVSWHFTRLHDPRSLVSQRRDGGKFRPTACFIGLNALAGPSMQRRLI